jgi:hypothetical protein
VSTYANAHQKAHHVRLLLLLKFLDICGGLAEAATTIFEALTLEGTHL